MTSQVADRLMSAGKKIGGTVYLHRSVVTKLVKTGRRLDAAALRLLRNLPVRFDWNVLKWGRDRLSLLKYDGFSSCWHPMYRASVVFPKFRGPGRVHVCTGMDRPILHRKELLVSASHPNREVWAERTSREEGDGLYQDTSRIGRFAYWETLCLEMGHGERRCPCPVCVDHRRGLGLPEVRT